MPAYNVTTEFEMTDGRVLSCEYGVSYTPAYICSCLVPWWPRYGVSYTPAYISGPPEDCYPEESDAGEPTYFIDGEEVDYKDLPKGLDAIADKLYEAGPGEYSYSQSDVDNEPDYEPDYDYY